MSMRTNMPVCIWKPFRITGEIGYRFEDRSQIPHINDLNNTQYLAKLLDITELLGMWPTHVVRLRDAVFCEQHEIDIHSPQASHDHLLEHRFFMSATIALTTNWYEGQRYFPLLDCSRKRTRRTVIQ